MAVVVMRYLANKKGQVRRRLEDLPQEIIMDILSRLPLESILTCRSVCKTLLCLTRDPYFIEMQLGRAEIHCILEPASWGGRTFELTHLPLFDIARCITREIPVARAPVENFQIRASYHGLLCIKASDGKAEPLYIYNPMTGDSFSLPRGSSRLMPGYLVCLGFDSSTRKYKVVRKRGGKKVIKFEILALGESSWKELQFPLLDWNAVKIVFCNRVFYCLMMRKNPSGNWSTQILALDITNENFQAIPSPVDFCPDRTYVDMVDVEGRLIVIEHFKHLMLKWGIAGNRVGELSLLHEGVHDTAVKWTKSSYYETIAKVDNRYLLWSTTLRHKVGDKLAMFSPNDSETRTLNISGLPHFFNAIRFTPTFICPLTASLW